MLTCLPQPCISVQYGRFRVYGDRRGSPGSPLEPGLKKSVVSTLIVRMLAETYEPSAHPPLIVKLLVKARTFCSLSLDWQAVTQAVS